MINPWPAAHRGRRTAHLARRLAALLLAVLVLGGPASALAQSSDARAAAEALFREGRELVEKGDLAAACPKFEASQQLDPTVGTLLNLASRYEQTGRIASAWAAYREVAERAARAGQKSRQEFARARAAELEPRLPRLVVRAAADNPPDLEVLRGEERVLPAMLGSTVPVDPGPIAIRASARGRRAYSTVVTAVEGETTSVEIPTLEHDPQEPAQPRPPVAESPGGAPLVGGPSVAGDAAPGRTGRLLAIGAGTAGVAAAAVGLGFGVSARSTWHRALDRCTDGLCDAEGVALGEDARVAARRANLLVGIGAGLLATGVILYLALPPGRAGGDTDPGAASIALTASGDGAGVTLVGEF
jgi:hypothetical protein